MLKFRAIPLAAIALQWAIGALAAGSFDGVWTGGADVPQGSKCSPTEIAVTVAEGKATGYTERRTGDLTISGTVAADGGFDGRVGRAHLVGKFSGDKFSGSYGSTECGGRRSVTLSRRR